LNTEKANDSVKTPSLKEKVKTYEMFLQQVHLALRAADMKKLKALIQNADTWGYVQSSQIPGVSKKEKQEILNQAFWKLTLN